MALLLGRNVLALYLVASALAGFDRCRLKLWGIAARLCAAGLVLSLVPLLQILGVCGAVGLISWNARQSRMNVPIDDPQRQQ